MNLELLRHTPITKGVYAIIKLPELRSENIIWNWKFIINLFYSPVRFDAYYRTCQDKNELIWEKEITINTSKKDIAIEYFNDLKKGYYLLDLSLASINKKYKSKDFYYVDPKVEPYLIIGLPYSIYKPIRLRD